MDPALIAARAGVRRHWRRRPCVRRPARSRRRRNKRVKAVAGARAVDRRKQAVDIATLKRKQTTQEALKELAQNEKQSRKRRFSVKGQIEQAGLKLTPTMFWIDVGRIGRGAGAWPVLLVQGPIGAGDGLASSACSACRAGCSAFWSAAGRRNSPTNSPTPSTSSCAASSPACRSTNACASSPRRAPSRCAPNSRACATAQAMGVPLDQSLQRMYDRMPLPEVNFFAIVLVIQQKTGGNLSESLGNLSTVLRSRKTDEGEGEGALLGSQGLGHDHRLAADSWSWAMVYFTRPDYISVLFTDPARPSDSAGLRGDDVARHFHHAQDGQLQVLRRARHGHCRTPHRSRRRSPARSRRARASPPW